MTANRRLIGINNLNPEWRFACNTHYENLRYHVLLFAAFDQAFHGLQLECRGMWGLSSRTYIPKFLPTGYVVFETAPYRFCHL